MDNYTNELYRKISNLTMNDDDCIIYNRYIQTFLYFPNEIIDHIVSYVSDDIRYHTKYVNYMIVCKGFLHIFYIHNMRLKHKNIYNNELISTYNRNGTDIGTVLECDLKHIRTNLKKFNI